MVERTFFGWDRPLLEGLIAWLWERRDALPHACVIVPTAQSGRRLREALAERAAEEGSALLSPRVVTSGAFFQLHGTPPPSAEILAWMEILEGVTDWEPYAAAFPVPPGDDEAPGWSMGLAHALVQLRHSLEENSLSVNTAALRLRSTVEAERWDALALLEEQMERVLAGWSYVSRVQVAGSECEPLLGMTQVVVAGVPDLPPAVTRLLLRSGLPVHVLIGAPEEEQETFDEFGRPQPVWNERVLPLPGEGSGSVMLTAESRQQAMEVVKLVSSAQTSSGDLALGTADAEVAGELVRAFGRAGWLLHDPSQVLPRPIVSWLGAWRKFLSQPDLATAIDLLAFPQSASLVGNHRAGRVRALSSARSNWLCQSGDDLERVVKIATHEGQSLQLATETMRSLQLWRQQFLRERFGSALLMLLDVVDPEASDSATLRDGLILLERIIPRVQREHGFWIDLLCATLPDAHPIPADGRVLDVLGWMELFYEPGLHLIVCGMNEGMVPARAAADPWLSESSRAILKLMTEGQRAARDAYVFTAMLEARRVQGRVDLLLAKSGATGDGLLPSRLLLACEDKELPARVAELFRSADPPDASLAWERDWLWMPRQEEPLARLSVTTFSDYLACPQRFYLKHVLKMQAPEPERVEWNARDFGTVAHLVMEEWGRDEEARAYSKTEALEAWVHEALDRIVRERFGFTPPLAVRIQKESLRQRLSWFASVQACEAASGWEILEVEKKFAFDLCGYEVRGTIDRIERNRHDGRMRVLDYKTRGELRKPEVAHRIELKASTKVPEHLQGVQEVLCENAKGKTMLWRNLQLALYAKNFTEGIRELGYFGLGHTANDVRVLLWEDFTDSDVHSAEICAGWVLGQIQAKRFGPAVEHVEYDDFEVLAMDRALSEMMQMEGGNA